MRTKLVWHVVRGDNHALCWRRRSNRINDGTPDPDLSPGSTEQKKEAQRMEKKRKSEHDKTQREKKKATVAQSKPKEKHQKGKAAMQSGVEQADARQTKASRVDRSGTKRCSDCNTWLSVSLLDSKGRCLDGKACRKRTETGLGKRVPTKKKDFD